MDLSDGSDIEGNDELDETALLESEDEDAELPHSYSRFGLKSVKDEGFEEEEHHALNVEDGDVLDLELNDDDGLEFADEPGRSTVAPLRFASISNKSETIGLTEPNTDGYQHHMPDNYEEYDDDYDNKYEGKAEMDDEDDDEDSRNTRTRFHSERNPGSISISNNNALPNSFGNPIQTLGSGKPAMDDNRQRNWSHSQGQRQPSQGPRPRFHGRNSLLGDRPNQNHNYNQFHRARGPRMNGQNPNGPQFPGRIFTDFSHPPRIPNPHCPPQMREPCPPFPNQGPPPRQMQDPSLQGPPNPNMMNPPQIRQRLPIRQQRPMRPRGSNMPRHPHPNQWRNQRPPGPHQFPRMPMNPHLGQPNHNMHFMGGPGPRMFPPDLSNQHLFLEQGIRPEMTMQFNPFSAPPMQQQFPQQVGFPGGQLVAQHGLSLMGPPEMHVENIPQQNTYFNQQQQLHPQQPQYIQQVSSSPWPETQNHPHSWAPGPPGPPNFNLPLPVGGGQAGPNGTFIHPQVPDHGQSQGHTGPRTEETPTYPRPSYDHDNDRRYQQEYSSEHEGRPHGQDRHISGPEHDRQPERIGASNDRRSYEDRSYDYEDRGGYSRNHDRYPTKRKYDRELPHGIPEKAQRSEKLSPPRDKKTDELLKIREEATKTIGLDDDYIRKLEEQKKLREEILRKKAASRKRLTGSDEPDTVNVPQTSSATRPSIYINPKAFRGDLSALKLKNMEYKGGVPGIGTTNTMHMYTNAAGVTTKPRKVLRIIKDKYGNIINQYKVIVVPKQQPDARTTSA